MNWLDLECVQLSVPRSANAALSDATLWPVDVEFGDPSKVI
jgi:hypothetical protein